MKWHDGSVEISGELDGKKSVEKFRKGNKKKKENISIEKTQEKEVWNKKKDTLVRVLKDKQPFCGCGHISDVENILGDTLTI